MKIIVYKQAMNAMGKTIAGAASGETAFYAAPKDSQSQAKGQKSNEHLLFPKPERLETSDLFFLLFIFLLYKEAIT